MNLRNIIITAIISVLASVVSLFVSARTAWCTVSPLGCPTEQAATIHTEDPTPWSVELQTWAADLRQRKSTCTIFRESAENDVPNGQRSTEYRQLNENDVPKGYTGTEYGVEVPFLIDTKGFKGRDFFVEAITKYSAPVSPPSKIGPPLVVKVDRAFVEGRRVACSVWAQYPDWMGSSGWIFYVRLNVFERQSNGLESVHDSVLVKVPLPPIKVKLNGSDLADEAVAGSDALLWYPLRRVADRLGWKLQCDNGKTGCVRNDGQGGQIASVWTEQGERHFKVQSLGAGVGYVRVHELIETMHWPPLVWEQTNRQAIIRTTVPK